jgi:hypothetical protein
METMKGKKRKQRRGKEKTGVQGGVPLCAADTNFPKEREKINGGKEQRRNNGPCSVCIWTFQNFFGAFSNTE